jgi:hypothetical protein
MEVLLLPIFLLVAQISSHSYLASNTRAISNRQLIECCPRHSEISKDWICTDYFNIEAGSDLCIIDSSQTIILFDPLGLHFLLCFKYCANIKECTFLYLFYGNICCTHVTTQVYIRNVCFLLTCFIINLLPDIIITVFFDR